MSTTSHDLAPCNTDQQATHSVSSEMKSSRCLRPSSAVGAPSGWRPCTQHRQADPSDLVEEWRQGTPLSAPPGCTAGVEHRHRPSTNQSAPWPTAHRQLLLLGSLHQRQRRLQLPALGEAGQDGAQVASLEAGERE